MDQPTFGVAYAQEAQDAAGEVFGAAGRAGAVATVGGKH